MKNLLTTLFLSLLAGACSLPTIRALPADPDVSGPTVAAEPSSWNAGSRTGPRGQAPLYARDGSIVGAQEPGTIATSSKTGQTSSEGEGSRWTLLEQYQKAVQAREELEVEVQGLSAALDQAEANEKQLLAELGQQRELLAQYEGRIEKLEGESVDLAARLTTAQIRRLEAEKLLLETKLDWKRNQALMGQPTDAATPADPVSGAAASPPRIGQSPTSAGRTP